MKKNNTFSRKLFALVLTIATAIAGFSATNVYATDYYGGGEIAPKAYDVYSSKNFTTKIGKIYKYEGFTVLMQDRPYGNLWVEYSTSSGAKRGYIKVPVDQDLSRADGLGKVKTASTIYYGRTDMNGKYGAYATAGSVSVGEFVAILAKNDNWAYVEYNTTSGRKRGYMKYSNLTVYNRPGVFADLPSNGQAGTKKKITGKKIVYSGPTSLYTQVGYVEDENVMRMSWEGVYDNNNNMYESYYIEYESGGKTKSGYIVFGP